MKYVMEYDLSLGMPCPSCKNHIDFVSPHKGSPESVNVACECGFQMMIAFGMQVVKKYKFSWEKRES